MLGDGRLHKSVAAGTFEDRLGCRDDAKMMCIRVWRSTSCFDGYYDHLGTMLDVASIYFMKKDLGRALFDQKAYIIV